MRFHHYHHIEHLLAAVLRDIILELHVLLLETVVEVLQHVDHGALVHGFVDDPLEALGKCGDRQLLNVTVVLALELPGDARFDRCAQAFQTSVHGFVLLNPCIVDGGKDLLQHLEDGDRAVQFHIDGLAFIVGTGRREGEGFGFPHIHAHDGFLEACGHVALAQRVGAAVGVETSHGFAVFTCAFDCHPAGVVCTDLVG